MTGILTIEVKYLLIWVRIILSRMRFALVIIGLGFIRAGIWSKVLHHITKGKKVVVGD